MCYSLYSFLLQGSIFRGDEIIIQTSRCVSKTSDGSEKLRDKFLCEGIYWKILKSQYRNLDSQKF